MLDPQEKARIDAWASSYQEAQRRAREDAIVGNFTAVRVIRHLQHEKDEVAAQQAEEDAKAKADKLAADNAAALDSRHRAHELSVWRYSGMGTDEQFEKQWPARRSELGRAEINKSLASTEHSLYRDL